MSRSPWALAKAAWRSSDCAFELRTQVDEPGLRGGRGGVGVEQWL